jgi:hypothetical protein
MGQKKKQAKLSFIYDRLWEQKLSQAYHLLVPDHESTLIDKSDSIPELLKKSVYEDRCNLYESILHTTEGK